MEGIQVTGFDSIVKLFPKMEKQIRAELKKGIAASALLIQNEAKKSMKSAKHGKTVSRGAAKKNSKGRKVASKFHRTSAPGEAPAVDTGRLMNSINHQLTNDGMAALVGILDLSNVKYGRFLEYGTARIQARPWLFPALEKNRKQIQARLAEAMQRGIAVK